MDGDLEANPAARARRLVPLVLPLLLLLLFAHEKLEFDPVARFERAADGLFYYQIAQHVADGDGLRTSVSLYGKGLRSLPAPATVQPLWPLCLGFSARWLGLDRAAAWLPELLFFASLVLLYLLANRVGRALGGAALVSLRGVPVLDLGTAAIAVFGSNAVYFAYTSKPYTEALGFCLLFGALLALPAASSQRPLQRAALAGGLAGLAYLTRSQWIAVPLALAISLLVAAPARASWRRALAALAASLAVVLPWIAFLLASVGSFPIRTLVDFSAYRETVELSPPAFVLSFPTLHERLVDALLSFGPAFAPGASSSYIESFGPIAYAAPLALGLLAWRALKRRGPPEAAARPLASDPLVPLATLLVAVAALAPVHLAHMQVGPEWLFGRRHGLVLILALVPALALLAQLGALARAGLVAAIGAGLLFPALQPLHFVAGNQRPSWPAETQLMHWLDAHPEPPAVLGVWSRSLAAHSRAVAHDLLCTGPDDAVRQLELLPVDYLVVYPGDVAACFHLGQLMPGWVEPVRSFGRGPGSIKVLRSRGRWRIR